LPNISGSELKVLAAVLYNYILVVKFFNQSGTQPVKIFNQSEMQLVKKFYQSEAQLVKKFYQSGTKLVKNFYQLQPESEESERELINNLSIKDSLSDSLNPESSKKILLLKKLRACGVYLKTAQAIVNQHDEAAIEQYPQLQTFPIRLSGMGNV
jgi:hypothetical protein